MLESNGLEIVHYREDTLLHLSGILGTKDDHFHTFKVDLDGSCGAHTLGETIGRKLTGVVDDKIWFSKVCQFFLGGANKHVVHEESMVGSGTNNPDFNTVFRIPAGEAIKDIYVLASIQIINSSFAVNFKCVYN